MNYIFKYFYSLIRFTKQRAYKFTKRLADNNFHSSKKFYLWELKRHVDKRTKKGQIFSPLLVYTMPKVGSSSIYVALKQIQQQWPVFHIHSLNMKAISENEKIYVKKWHKGQKPTPVWQSQFVIQKFKNSFDNKKIKIITLVRDPVARNISHFFETLNLINDYDYNNKLKIQSVRDTIDEITPLFFSHFPYHDYALQWFDNELNTIFNTDVYQFEFSKSKGYQIISEGYANVLIIRLENLNKCIDNAMKNFLDLDRLQLIQSNIGANKDYSNLYSAFLENLVLPDSYIDKMYDSKYARHFYSPEEIYNFSEKWRRSSC